MLVRFDHNYVHRWCVWCRSTQRSLSTSISLSSVDVHCAAAAIVVVAVAEATVGAAVTGLAVHGRSFTAGTAEPENRKMWVSAADALPSSTWISSGCWIASYVGRTVEKRTHDNHRIFLSGGCTVL